MVPGTEHPGTEHPGTEHPGTEHPERWYPKTSIGSSTAYAKPSTNSLEGVPRSKQGFSHTGRQEGNILRDHPRIKQKYGPS